MYSLFFGGIYNRTVSANLGMSYSICNVLAEAGVDGIKRWVPFKVDDTSLRNSLRNKMVRPTTIPQTLQGLRIEQAIAREALRLAFEHHKNSGAVIKRCADSAHNGRDYRPERNRRYAGQYDGSRYDNRQWRCA